MRYLTFGRGTGLRVSEYGLGTVNFGTRWGGGAEPAEARKIFERFAEAGGTLLDTADYYQSGEAEELLGGLLGADRDDFVVSSKFTLGTTRDPRVSTAGNSRKNMIRSLEASLKRLRTDHIDVYWAHFPDAVTPVEEVLAAFDSLVRSGKILYAGLSNFPAWRVARAAAIAELRGWAPLVGVQIEYSLAERSADRELLPMADGLGLGAALWSPLGGGLLTGKYRIGSGGRLSDLGGRVIRTESSVQLTAVVDAVLDIARETGLPASRIAVAWVRAHALRAPTAYVPVIGPRTTDQLDDYLAALDVHLTDEQLARLDEVSAVPAGALYETTERAQRGMFEQGEHWLARPVLPVA
jgi:aryl-alcohol dehydrogenase-like predicted oxidoreductase